MTRYITLLRGINVGGINIKMADLRAAVADLGYADVKTVLASGNVLFDSDRTDVAGLKSELEARLRDRFGYEAWVIVLDQATLRAVVDGYPFEPDREGWHPYVLFGSDPAVLTELLDLAPDLDPSLERVRGGDGVLYWEVERGHTLDSRFGKTTGRARYKPSTTTRNLRTLRKLL
ncbi:DUF1697 domain-containing protein [Rhodococcus sp. D2-41]|uniref:DUF1697 domain-containing protein n=1 Tax=Speluncibacter jeojiensis TaxID=2710754 RepID=A0A9X4RFV5_9ACTN|nr:DUF1697 domain-containing protein [Rhodococcus sp. D2-41]MDG3011905.1 DUF1697 domain-containing protein [Rhodococcus sp. D2-41]MDG3013356.1 DUF1697 domain-containing protein [Corynebacteriales bacterium D3-21]